MGKTTSVTPKGGEYTVGVSPLAENFEIHTVKLGDSIAVNGCCLTVVSVDAKQFFVDISSESLSRSTFKSLKVEDKLNLERSLRLSDRLDGHLVTGHVDGVGSVVSMDQDHQSHVLVLSLPDSLMPYMAEKGSVCVDGTSLTVNAVEDNTLSLMIIPFTYQNTIISTYKIGRAVNIEVDLLARYVVRLKQFENK